MSTASTEGDGALRKNLGFAYRLYGPRQQPRDVLILLHGSGVDETTMASLGENIAPGSLRIAVRGRIAQEDGWRWFVRITPTRFDQSSIRDEVAAFARFLHDLGSLHGFDPAGAVLLGYSNGANIASSLALLQPALVRRAVLLRAMPVLREVPQADLSAATMLVITGQRDITYARFAPALAALLRDHGAEVEARTVASGHELGPQDVAITREWLAARETRPAST